MKRQGPLTLRHLLVTGLVVLLVFVQLIWWTLFTIRESRARLQLERDRLTTSCRLLADQVERCLHAAESELRAESVSRRLGSPGQTRRTHFAEVRELPEDGVCAAGWQWQGDEVVLRQQSGRHCFEGRLRPLAEWLELPAEIMISPQAGLSPGIPLPPPFTELLLRPDEERWQAPLEDHHRRLRMFLSEGTFFLGLVLILVVLLWKTVRRDVQLQQQHRNFISAITHELKSPLAGVRISLETVLHGRADISAGRRFLENALQDVERLQGLVQKVLEVTRYGLGDAALRLDRADLSELTRNAAEAFSRRTAAAGVQLEVAIQSGISARADEESFSIVVSNLLENAIKYGGSSPTVGLSLQLCDEYVVLEVRDNGRGISDDDLPFIFDRFFRGEEEMTRTTRGTGLGLYLVRQIVSAHGGIVEVAETGPQGTTMRVLLPEAGLLEEEP